MEILHHFKYPPLIEFHLFSIDISINKEVIFIWIASLLVLGLMLLAGRRPKIIPGTLQGVAEVSVEFVKNELLFGMPEELQNTWVPFLLAIFSLILTCNIIGLVPGAPAVAANLNFTVTLAIIVFLSCQFYSVKKRGFLGFFKALIPEGVPAFIVPFLLPIEILTQLARPFSLAVRLFANIFAGHVIIIVLLTLVIQLNNFASFLPFLGHIIIVAFELFIGFIQAFIFTYLSAMYITEAVVEH